MDEGSKTRHAANKKKGGAAAGDSSKAKRKTNTKNKKKGKKPNQNSSTGRRWIYFLVTVVSAVILAAVLDTKTAASYTKLQEEWYTQFNEVQNLIKEVGAHSVTLMTFNLRHSDLDRETNTWKQRRTLAAEVIKKYAPMVIGTQEGSLYQMNDLLSLLPSTFTFTGNARGRNFGEEYTAILWDTTVLERLDGHTFWLSETPDVPNSMSWGSSLPRMVTWVKFRLKKEKNVVFYVANTHMDHVSELARKEGAKLILEELSKLDQSVPIFLLGDFNAAPGHASYRILTNGSAPSHFYDSWKECGSQSLGACRLLNQVSTSFHAYYGLLLDSWYRDLALHVAFWWHGAKTLPTWGRYHIDWILSNHPDTVKPRAAMLAVENHNGQYPSDHFPYVAIYSYYST